MDRRIRRGHLDAHRCSVVAALAAGLIWVAPQRASALTRVELKSGVTLDGTVLAELPGGDLRMILLDGSKREIAAADIASIHRAWLPPSSSPYPSSPPPSSPPAAPSAPPAEARQPTITPPASRTEVTREDEDEDAKERRAEHERAATGQRAEEDIPRGWYFGGLFLGAVAPAFPGVAGAAGGEAFAGYRHDSSFDSRFGLAGFGATFPTGTLAVVGLRFEEFLWLAGPYGISVGLGPFVGVSDDFYGSSTIGGAHFSATPVALRVRVGAAILEGSIVGGALVGDHELIEGAFVRPFGFLGFAAYSR